MTATESPFLNAKKTIDVRNWYDKQATRMWRMAACGAFTALFMALVAVGMLISRQKFSVQMVAVDGTGREVGTWPAGQSLKVTDEMKRARLSDWIIEARTVSPDPVVTRRYVDNLFASVDTGSAADAFLKAYYAGGMSPLARAATCTVDPEPESVVALSDKTYQVRWKETTRSLGGEVQSVEQWTAAITLVVSPATSAAKVNRLNGLGIYVTHLSWSREGVK